MNGNDKQVQPVLVGATTVAAQEAVAIVKIIGGAAHDFCYLAAGLADGEYSLFAAAPVDLANWAAHYSINPAAVEALQSMLTGTPAAPGIDVDALAQEIRRVDGNHSLGAGALAEALVEWLSRHVIDASPKGGSTDAKDAARYRWLRDSSGNAASDTPSTIVMADEGGWDFVFGPDLDKATDAAMQATSAEVGA